ncbi:hypothetical protein KSF_088790 [Reticulibacter mediterranei]|uniref:Insecticidal toxin complex protein n=1 Tax=Reticulibacter mediterranei TaxID=2778369 RepID=A0A8J3IQD1_9CHLR|nr:hypothetical protein [Reticulibacter mediterranei]GHO98831.1 hypothetical protein KSF_088790 [Reticulibacter mediterranei]
MADYIVIRLTPPSPVDGATFAAYLDDLHIQVFPANLPLGTPPQPLGSAVYSSPLILIPAPGVLQTYLGIASKLTAAPTAQVGPNDYGTVLEFASTEGIAVGSWLFSAQDHSPFAPGITVIEVKEQSVTLSNSLPNYVPAGTTASFILDYGNVAPWITNPPALSFAKNTNAAIAAGATVLQFTSTDGITVGMTVNAQPGIIDNNTTVIAANQTSVTLSRPTLSNLPQNTPVTFTFKLSAGVIQQVNPDGISIPGFGFLGYNPASVATAIIELSAPPPAYLDISVVASRHGIKIPVDTTFYDVLVSSGPLPTPDEYQNIPSRATSFYMTLPAPPASKNPVNLTQSSNGTPPPFNQLLAAVQNVLNATPGGPPALETLTEAQCRKIAYEIVWSQQKPLPAPPDPLGDLYTNPPNNGDLLDGTNPNKNEGDRQQFEGDLQKYYAKPNAEAERLVGFVYSLSAAVACFKLSQQAPTVRFQFPIIVDQSKAAPAGVKEGAVLLTNGNAPMNPGFAVPVEYFYALGAGLPTQVTPQQQYQMACLASKQQLLPKLHHAIDTGIISAPVLPPNPPNPEDPDAPTITPEQAVRQLNALGKISSTDPTGAITIDDLPSLVGAWLGVTGDDAAIDTFWQTAVTTYKSGYLDLILCVVTGGFQKLIDAIKASWQYLDDGNLKVLTVGTVQDLIQVTAEQWHDLFIPPQPPHTPPPPPRLDLLPPFIAAGTPDQRVKAFVRQLQNFFTVSSGSTGPSTPTLGAPPTFPGLMGDPLLSFINNYGSLTFGSAFPSQPAFQNALDATFQDDEAAKAWLTQVLETINDLYIMTAKDVLPPGQPPAADHHSQPELQFSVMEALYARGVTNLYQVQHSTLDNFQEALTGTIAYNYAAQIYQNTQAEKQPGEPGDQEFQPINPDGCLVNCVPPLYLSPLGPVAYLHDLLSLSVASTCENPLPKDVKQTLEDMIAQRRGPLGLLQVTEANLETPLPLIDIVNECLEAVAAQVPSPPAGVVHNTAGDRLDEHKLCAVEDDTHGHHHSHKHNKHTESCHNPAALFETVPQYSSPATLVAQAGAYDQLKSDFSSPLLPYSQPLDISRSYLRQLKTSRYAVMRRFRKDITEFVLDPAGEPGDFQRHLWRYPVRIEIAREYLGITPEEYDLLFTQDIVTTQADNQLLLWQVYYFASETFVIRDTDVHWTQIVAQVPEFLKRTGLSYCEFLELWKSEFVKFRCSSERQADENGAFPDCEPCCLDNCYIEFEEPENPDEALKLLAVFVRLWRKLQHVKSARYSFTQLCDICNVLKLFDGGSINPDFIRQLAAFQILRDHLGLWLTNNTDHMAATGQAGADRTHLLALWVGPGADKWTWAVQQLLDRVQHYARMRHQCGPRPAHFIKLLAENLDPLSQLSGFDPNQPADTWHALPTHTLRFAEVLSKIYASDFSVGEILFLFTADKHLDGDDPFPLPEDNEALDFPLDFPDDDDKEGFSLQALRRKLLHVRISEEEAERWTWWHIESSLRYEFGYEPSVGADPLLSIGEHFFPDVLSACGNHVDMKQRQYRVPLAAVSTTPAMWNTPDSPFRYDTATQELWIRLPLMDEEVFEKLSHIRQLNQEEQDAVQNLYFAPRADLAAFTFIFSNFGTAVEYLVQEDDEEKRWSYFRHAFAHCHARSHVIAEHLTHHVAATTGQEQPDGVKLAWRLLQHLFADENMATGPWEADDGQIPDITWQPRPNGGAFAALLGLTGTGLLGEFLPEDGNLTWREVRGPMNAFGHEKNRWNIPVPTVLPSMDLSLSPAQARLAGIRNGFAIKGRNAEPLGGPEGFGVRWQGILLIEHEGMYEFYAGAPTPEGERPDFEAAEQHGWCVTLQQGQKTWVVLAHHWPNTQAPAAHAAPLQLKRGAYQLTVVFVQPEAVFTQVETCPQHTGFEVKYRGPDSEDHLVAIPLDRLYRDEQDEILGRESREAARPMRS